jgi:hypothetical protein
MEFGLAYSFFLTLFKNSATSRNSYLNFCEFTIQCLHTSASHLNDRDQRLPADRPYTNGYFLDLVSQVRRYAAMVRAERERVQATQGSESNKETKSPMYVTSHLICTTEPNHFNTASRRLPWKVVYPRMESLPNL